MNTFAKKGKDMLTQWVCKDCGWKGDEHKLDYETVEGCVGDDKLETCPKCGSHRIFIV